MQRSSRFSRIILYAVLFGFALAFLLPVYVMIVTSFKDVAEIRRGGMLSLPEAWTTAAWLKAWGSACTGIACDGLKPYFFNSIRMVVPSVILSTAIGALNGYALAQWHFRGADIVFTLLLLGFFVPYQTILLPAAQFLGHLGISNTIVGLVVIHVGYGIAFTTMLFRNFYVNVPPELVKAARVDGAGFFLIFRKIFLPISAPILIVCVIWQFTQIWNDYLFGAAFSGTAARPVTVGLNNLVNTSEGVKEYNVDMAAALITALPTLLVYIIGSRYFVRGLTAGAVKG
jgi:glucose/mannose transport system permease protein